MGQSVPCSTHRRRLRPDAGGAIAGRRYRLCPRSSLHVARTTAKAGCSGIGLGTTSRRPSAGFLPVSTRLPSSRSGTRSCNRITPPQPSRTQAKYLPSPTVVEPCFFLSCLQSCNWTSSAQNPAFPSPGKALLPDYNPLSTPTVGSCRASCIMRANGLELRGRLLISNLDYRAKPGPDATVFSAPSTDSPARAPRCPPFFRRELSNQPHHVRATCTRLLHQFHNLLLANNRQMRDISIPVAP